MFFGKYNGLNIRKLETIRITFSGQCDGPLSGSIMTNVANACA